MKVLLINPNNIKPPVIPIGMVYIATYLKQHDVEVIFVDLCFDTMPQNTITKELKENKPDIIGIGIRNIDNLVYTKSKAYLDDIKDIVTFIKATLKNTPIVVGGAGYSIFPTEVYKFLDVDFGIIGEGEKSFLELCHYLAGDLNGLEEISGLVYKDNNNVRINTINNMSEQELNMIPFPDYSILDWDRYYYEGGVCPIQTKRGCALKCIYCTYPIIEGECFRLRDPHKVVDEMEYMKNRYGMDYFYIVDSIFNVPFDHTEQICDEIIRRNLKINWFAYLSPVGFTKKRLEKLYQSGADGIWFSVDTCSDVMLKRMGKGYNLNTLRNAVNLCKKIGMRCHFILVLGGPGENEETLKETFDFLNEVQVEIVIIMYGLRVYPGTQLLTEIGDTIDRDSLLQPYFYLSPSIKDIQAVIKDKIKGKSNWFLDSTNPTRIEQVMHIYVEKKIQDCYKKGLKGPYWAIIDKLLQRR